MKIAGATLNQIPLNWQHNVTNIVTAIQEAKKRDVKILCLPELCITGYGCEDLFLHRWVAAKAVEKLAIISDVSDDITVAVGLPLRVHDKLYNGACVISNKKILGITLKQNLAKDGVHYEPRWFEKWPAGKTTTVNLLNQTIEVGDIVYEHDDIRFGFEICEDAWQENTRPGFSLKDRKVDLILNPSASHFAMGKSTVREKQVVVDGSKLFNCTYLFVNHLGNEAGRMIYDGDIIIAQQGKLLAVNRRLSFRDFNLLVCDVNFVEPATSEVISSLDNKDRNEELAQAVSLALFDYMRKSKSKGYVLSLSGGADSSICAVLVAEMAKRGMEELGASSFCSALSLDEIKINGNWRNAVSQILTCAYQGTVNSSADTLNAAGVLAESIGATFYQWKIDEEVSSYTRKIEHAIEAKLTWDAHDIALQNIQARTRSPIIWLLANLRSAVLLTTSNRSEGDVGYATMDGDTSGSLAPIAGLSKVFILQWLKWAEKTLDHPGLNAVNNLQPTAELRPLDRNQTDEKDLMPYSVLAEIEKHAIRDGKSPVEVFQLMKVNASDANVLKSHIKKFFLLWSANQWKRERLAPSFHLDDLNVDPRSWCRFPILSSGFREELEILEKLT
ncbi:MAG TPA: NAD(+) synthase [Chryseosolibacter sp.]|nr:NAD(+) synthase [Chryseosolibacter sp.]